MTYTEIATYAFAALGFVATLANAASLAVPAGSTLGRWLAWIASMPIKALPPDAKQKARVAAEMAKTMGPPLVLVACLSAITATQGCALFRSAVVAGKAACQSELVNAPDVIAEAKVRGVSVGQLVDAFCGLVDVAAIFTSDPKPGVARQAMSPRDQAVTLLRAKGELQ